MRVAWSVFLSKRFGAPLAFPSRRDEEIKNRLCFSLCLSEKLTPNKSLDRVTRQRLVIIYGMSTDSVNYYYYYSRNLRNGPLQLLGIKLVLLRLRFLRQRYLCNSNFILIFRNPWRHWTLAPLFCTPTIGLKQTSENNVPVL